LPIVAGGCKICALIELIQRYKWWLLLVILLGGGIAIWEEYRVWREDSQDAPILAAAQKYHVDPALVKAVVWRESRFDPTVRGTKQERGLMQIRPTTAQEWVKEERVLFFSPNQLFDPGKNTQVGTWYLRKLIARYGFTDNPLAYALADYNAGRTQVLRWNKGAAATNSVAFLNQMDFPGTRDYVQSVLQRYEKYRRVFPPKKR
jgi:soluble lytic murein transglycosylase